MKLCVDGKELVPGEDFIIEPGSPSLSGIFPTIHLEVPDILNQEVLLGKLKESKGKFIVVGPYNRKDFSKEEQKQIEDLINFLKYHPENPAEGTVLLTNNKLTWSASTVQYRKPTFIVENKKVNFKESIETLFLEVEGKFFEKYKSQNVLGYIEGEEPDSLMVFIAHYDHLGMMGSNTVFPGANDNASGVAMLLNLAKYYALNKPKYRSLFIAFGGEELGLIGSKYFV
ncbi:M28 family peptidase, partial [Cytophagales bacterium RKSG123]|nr:M28 family peptidase [Xanthovirga aplysinae]